MHRIWLAALLVPALACTSGEDIALLHREVTDVQREVQQLKATSVEQGDLKPLQQSLQEETTRLARANAELSVRIEKLEQEVDALRASLEVANRRIDRLSQDLASVGPAAMPPAVIPPVTTGPEGSATSQSQAEGAAPAQETGGTPAAQATPPAAAPVFADTPEALYQSAYRDYMGGNYQLALNGFQEYIKRFPTTDLTDNAQYWVGECYDALGQEKEALEAFSTLLEKYPTSDKAAAAQLKKGLVALKMGDQGQGVVNLQYVVYEHPGTPEADLAREKLRSLGITIR